MKDIPYSVYQYWHSSELTESMYNLFIKNSQMNPEFDFYFFDEERSREFLKKNFEPGVLNAFDTLKPNAYRSDLMRLCLIYKKGGVYIDAKFEIVKPLKEYVIQNQNMFAKNDNENKVFNGFFIVKPNEPVLGKCIDKIVEHVENRYYGEDPHWPTGPGLIGDVMVENGYIVPNEYIHFVLEPNNIHSIIDKKTNETILRQYSFYRQDQSNYKNSSYWDKWLEKNIYHD